jgi:hypothetical protein
MVAAEREGESPSVNLLTARTELGFRY